MIGTKTGKRFGLAVVAVLGLAAFTAAQNFPTYKGNNARTGRNESPNTSGPGPANLTWFRPDASDNAGRPITIDNNDLPVPATDPAFVSQTGSWIAPPIADEAPGAFLPNTANVPPTMTRSNIPGHLFSEAIASDVGTDPRRPLNATDTLSIFTWNLRRPEAPFFEARDFAIYVWITPTPMIIGGAQRFPQRFYVFEVVVPGAAPFIDVVDTERAGGGWVRLGNGGLPTTKLFSSSGVLPIQVRLYNTVPRDPATGRLTTNPGPTNDLDPNLPRPVVYADAVMAVPHIGSYAATPIVSSFLGASGSLVRTVGVLNTTTPGAEGALIELDNGAAGVSPGAGWSSSTIAANFRGSDYLSQPISTDPGIQTAVTYAPSTLSPGEYEIYAWLPGSSNGEVFGTSVEYRIYEGTLLTTVHLDQDASMGWVQVGSRKFAHSTAPGQGLRVEVSNFSTNAADAGRKAFADALGFTSQNTREALKAVVTSYDFANGVRRWRFSPLEESDAALNVDNTSASVTRTGTAWVSSTAVPNFRGTDHFSAPIVNDALSASTVEYEPGSPTLADGTYDIYVWLPGESVAEPHSQQLVYEVHEGEDITTVEVNQVPVSGWLRIGTRRFEHSSVAPLKLVVTNFSAEPTDVGKFAYTDAVRFVGASSLAVASTPVQQNALVRLTPGGPLVERGVVIVAAENGKIYCLDAEGRGDGTTDVLWTYPSSVDPGADPNLNAPDEIDGRNGQLIAQMPTRFDLSSALIQRIDPPGAEPLQDFLFIAAQNGRVYCIEMGGRGDLNTSLREPGTTKRVWTYPNDFPANPVPSTLGAFFGSVAYAESTGGPTLIVPTEQGRLYALDAVGNPTTRTTTTRWTYPLMDQPTLGPITTTPAIEFGKVFFGTSTKDGVLTGQFLAVNLYSGLEEWRLTPPADEPLDDFVAGPATVTAATLGGGMPDTVFVANSNRIVYALYEGNGSIIWKTDELEAPAVSALTYSFMQVTNNSALYENRPVIIVPRSDGVISMLSAREVDLTLTGRRRARGDFFTESPSLTAGVAAGWNFLYYADNAGYLYARSATAGGFPPDDFVPGGEGTGENEPGYADYSQAQIKLIKRDAYTRLRQGTMYYVEANDPINALNRNAFEWGETMYILVSNFPYKVSGQTVPPTVSLSFNVGGSTVRNVFANAQHFTEFAQDHPSSGYAVAVFPIQGGGANALPPGPGQISANFNVVGSGGAPQVFSGASPQQIFIAHPLALYIQTPGYTDQSIGYTTDLTLVTDPTFGPQLIRNGTPDFELLSTAGTIAHGQSGASEVLVVDRSLMTLLRPDLRGLSNVKITRPELAWQGGTLNVQKPIDPFVFPNFEDLPINFPNTSLDYPDISREQVQITKSASGDAQNPVFFGVDLLPPRLPDGSKVTEDTAGGRELYGTPFNLRLEVPRFQPANLSTAPSAAGELMDAGYKGTFFVYVDSDGNQAFTRSGGWSQSADGVNPINTREAYRSFSLGAAISMDERMSVTTPTLDLGSLAAGLGYTPVEPGPANPAFSPWDGAYQSIFKPFTVVNEGNVNLVSLRLAKGTSDGAVLEPWRIFSAANDDLTYLDGSMDMFSDLDPGFAPTRDITAQAPVILQKSRVGDRAPRELSVNPIRRQNPTLGVIQDEPLLDPTAYPPGAPRVAITPPFGFPIGTYSALVRVIEDNVVGDDPGTMIMNLDPVNPWYAPSALRPDPFTDPTLRLTFKVTEARNTGGISPFTAPMVDPSGNDTAPFRRQNRQPTALRSPVNGSLLVAWTSDRSAWGDLVGTTATSSPAYKIFVAGVNGETPTVATGSYPLRDLHAFQPAPGDTQWFLLPTDAKLQNGFPAEMPGTVFGSTGTVVDNTVRYGSPSFPAAGLEDPFREPGTGSLPYNYALMGFVGEAQFLEAGGRVAQSKIFLAPVTIAEDGTPGVGEIIAMTNDPNSVKGKPSVLQTNEGAVVFYSATTGSQSRLYYTFFEGDASTASYDGSRFSQSFAIPIGQGFESANSPSVTGRRYVGEGAPPAVNMIEMTFSGKIRGRPNSEIFYARFDYLPGEADPIGLLELPRRTDEQLVASREAGVYQAQGVNLVSRDVMADDPDVNAVILKMARGTGVPTDIEFTQPDSDGDGFPERPSRQYNSSTGIVTFRTLLGGTAYVDLNMGTVRLANATVPRDANLFLSYTPLIMRISETSSAGFVAPSLAVDERLVPEIGYWSRTNETAVDLNDAVRAGRFLFMYNRAAAGAGQSARPFLKTMRFGIDLPTPVFTTPDGVVQSADLVVNGETSFYQIDPGKGKVYFTTADEGRQVTITYRAADPATGNSLGTRTVTTVVGLITERPEAPMPLDRAINESNISLFLDPFDSTDPTQRRPGLFWLFWTSNRTGTPDLFFQTMAPRFAPIPEGKS